MSNGKFWKEFWRLAKYGLVASSAALIQFGVCTFMDEVLGIDYWISYLVALVLSVLWNFTINRKVTFKSVANVPIAMLKVFGYYCVFTPLSLWFSNWAIGTLGWPDPVVTIINIAVNGITEYLFMRLFVFGKTIDTAVPKKKVKKSDSQTSEEQEAINE